MSTFGGKIEEFPGISVDRFDGENEHFEVYFLSHCHTDHMVGLSNVQFQKNLVNNRKYLFGSPITCIILSKLYPDIKNNLKELSLYLPTNIMFENSSFSVTTVPAGHCPGSIMFLFEGKTRILYTGDFRIHKGDSRKFKSFYDSFNNVKSIEKVYLDTTFFTKEYLRFPRREDSLNELCTIIEEWLDQGSLFMINLVTSAKYGYEYLFIEIYRKLGMPIHVNDEIYNFYCLIPEMDKSITTDGSITRIHSHCGATYQTTCSYKSHGVVKPIKVSAFRWNQKNLSKGISSIDQFMHYVCYSTHSSYEEAVDLIQFLKPKEVEICVKPSDPQAYSILRQLIQEVLKDLVEDEYESEDSEVEENMPKLFKVDETVVKKEISDDLVKVHEDWKVLEEDELASIMDLQPNDPYRYMLDSPPREDKPSADVLESIMDLSPAKKTLKGIIKRKQHALKHERSSTLLDSSTESGGCSNKWEDSEYLVDDRYDEVKPGCSKNIVETTCSKVDLTRESSDKKIFGEFDHGIKTDQSGSELVAKSTSVEKFCGKIGIADKTEPTATLFDEFDPRQDLTKTAHSASDGKCSEDNETQPQKLITEENFLLDIIESEPNPSLIGEIDSTTNDCEENCSVLYDILGISPPK